MRWTRTLKNAGGLIASLSLDMLVFRWLARRHARAMDQTAREAGRSLRTLGEYVRLRSGSLPALPEHSRVLRRTCRRLLNRRFVLAGLRPVRAR